MNIKTLYGFCLVSFVLLGGCQPAGDPQAPTAGAPSQAPGVASEASAPAQAVDGRPNILLILADDLGFFGSEIYTPNLDALAMDGLRFTNFHAAPSCAPTRALLMSGTTIVEAGVRRLDDPLRDDIASLPERLRAAGYQTFMACKWNLGIAPEDSPAARGCDASFALMKAADNHLGASLFPGNPSTYEGHYTHLENGEPVALPEGWFSSRLYTDKLIEYLQVHAREGQPWFGYLALTAPHWPLQAPEDWIDRYAGRYDEGYDALRESRYQRARELGILPENLALEGYSGRAEPWETLTAERRAIRARSMEIYAAMVENMDMHIGRVVDFLRASGQLQNTVILFTSDNGAAGEDLDFMPRTLPRTDTDNSLANMGREGSFTVNGPGWSEAAMAPYRDRKGSLYAGGTLVPTFIRHGDVAAAGGIDRTYLTFMDILPTLIEVAGQSSPSMTFQRRDVQSVRGRSFWGLVTGRAGAVRDAGDAVPWMTTNRGALVRWPMKIVAEGRELLDAQLVDWELYDLETDPGERRDLADEHPELTAELAETWLTFGWEAVAGGRSLRPESLATKFSLLCIARASSQVARPRTSGDRRGVRMRSAWQPP